MNAAKPRYASVLPPPVGKNSRSTTLRSACVGSEMPGRFIRMNAELEGTPTRSLGSCQLSVVSCQLSAVSTDNGQRTTDNGSAFRGNGHCPIGNLESLQALRIAQERDPLLDAVGRHFGSFEQLLGRVIASRGAAARTSHSRISGNR